MLTLNFHRPFFLSVETKFIAFLTMSVKKLLGISMNIHYNYVWNGINVFKYKDIVLLQKMTLNSINVQ